MTLSTNVYVLDAIDRGMVFEFCQGLLAKYDDRGPSMPQEWKDTEGWRTDCRSLHNVLGQGLPAILDITYRLSGPLRTAEQSAEHDPDICNVPESDYFDDTEPLCDKTEHDPACWLDVDFDTAYSYRDSRGWGCGDLHAVLVAELGAWLATRGVRWKWRNEFTGEVHDDAESLIELVSGGFEATAWFATAVLPAIVADVASKGGGTLNVGGRDVEIPDGSAS